MKKVSPYWVLALLATVCFTLATLFVPRAGWWNNAPSAKDWNGQSQSDNTFKLLFGEGRKLFANQMLTMADVYFHSGYYPSMFDRQEQSRDVAAPALGQTEDTDSTSDDFLGPPPDWIAILGRNFVPNRHTHLDAGGPSGHLKVTSVQEILPWLRFAVDMNPQMIVTYRVGAYWLSDYLNNPTEAKVFLREGLRNNPGNYELLYDLGQVYYQNYHDTVHARNLWKAALRRWLAQSDADKKDTKIGLDEIAMNLGHLERDAGNGNQAIHYYKIAMQASPNPSAIQKQIDEIKARMAAHPPAAPTNSIH